jgi:hypothetical protein
MNLRNHRCDPTLLSTVAPRKAATCTHRIAQAQDKLTLISMLQVELEPTIPVFEWAKTVHALYREATVMDRGGFIAVIFLTTALNGGQW